MRIQVLSDLHLEFGAIDIPDTDADVVVLAGDIDVGAKGLDWIQRRFPRTPVVYVLGNHEFYQHQLPDLTESLRREAKDSHIHVLENSAVELAGVRFLGCTLWTDFNLSPNPIGSMGIAERLMSDYRLIRFGGARRSLKASDTVALHQESVAWLERELRRGHAARTVVVTHHAPSPRSEAPGYVNGPLSPAFISNLNPMLERSRVPLWIHGHTHHNVDYQAGSTRVLSNQRGYPLERCAGFDPALVIEI